MPGNPLFLNALGVGRVLGHYEIASMFDGRLETEEEWVPGSLFPERVGCELMRVMVKP